MREELDIVFPTTDELDAELERGEQGTLVHTSPTNIDYEIKFPATRGQSGAVASSPKASFHPLNPVVSGLRN